MKNIRFFVDKSQISEQMKLSARLSYHIEKSLHYREIDKGYVLMSRAWHGGCCDGGVVDADLNFVDHTGYSINRGCGYDFDSTIAAKGSRCIFIGSFHTVYGHAITDALRKLWFLNTAEGQQLIGDGYEIVYITTKDSKMPQWFLHILEMATVNKKQFIHLHTTTRYDKIIVPDDSLVCEDNRILYTEVFRSTIETIKERVRQTDIYKQVPEGGSYYFTRTGCNHIMREMGEPALEKEFKKQGFEIISPEQLPFEHQVSLLMKCQRQASTESSTSHAAIFCTPESEVIILRKADYENKYSMMIADFVGNKTVFIDANHSIKTNKSLPMLGPFYLFVTQNVRTFFNSKSGGVNICLHPSYWLYLWSKHKIVNFFLRLYDKLIRRGLGWRRVWLG